MPPASSRSKERICLLILAVDTSGKTASAAAVADGLLLGSRMVYTARAHSQILLPMAKEMLAETGHTVQEVDVFAAADGPGSYTGLRIGVAAVQALAFAGGKRCVGVSALEGIAWNLSAFRGVICAALSARQNLCYCAFFRSDAQGVTRLTNDAVIPAETIAAQAAQYGETVMLAGDGTPLLLPLIANAVPAPLHLMYQSACGIAAAAMHKEPVAPEQLCVRYLQKVKIG